MLGTGLLIGAHWVLFLSARLATASVCLAALPTIMLWCSLMEPLFNRTYRWSAGELLTGIVMVGAVWLIYHFEFKHWLGFTVGIASAFLGAVFAVINKLLTPHQPPMTICFYQMTGACVGCAATLPMLGAGQTFLPSSSDLLWLLVLSQVCTVGAYVAYLDLLRCMSVFTINVVYNLEPVYGIVLAALIFGERERMSGGFLFGGVCDHYLGRCWRMPFCQSAAQRSGGGAAGELKQITLHKINSKLSQFTECGFERAGSLQPGCPPSHRRSGHL